jgi:hypothetical protein
MRARRNVPCLAPIVTTFRDMSGISPTVGSILSNLHRSDRSTPNTDEAAEVQNEERSNLLAKASGDPSEGRLGRRFPSGVEM